MTSKTSSVTSRPNALPARLLAFVLLAFVTYASTAEAVHKHGNLLIARSVSSTTAGHFSDDEGYSTNDSRVSGECLICQLRQQLSVSLLSALPQVVAPQDQAPPTRAAILLCASRSDTPQRGRAPPLASLL